MKYIIDIPNADVSRWVAETPLGKKLYIPISVEDGKEYSIATEIYAEEYTEPDRKAIEDEVWKFASMLMNMHPDVAEDIYWSMNGGKGIGVAVELSYQEAKEKYEAWKESKEEIRVGDEVTDNDLGDIGVVTYVNDSCYCILWSSGVVSEDVRKSKLRRTGRHFNITHELLKKMKEGDRP